jgi:site-specific recombinase XerD
MTCACQRAKEPYGCAVRAAKPRDLPIHAQLRTDLQAWLDERPGWPGAGTSPALLLNRRGQRLSVRGASDIIRAIAAGANLDEEHITAHVGRHTFVICTAFSA